MPPPPPQLRKRWSPPPTQHVGHQDLSAVEGDAGAPGPRGGGKSKLNTVQQHNSEQQPLRSPRGSGASVSGDIHDGAPRRATASIYPVVARTVGFLTNVGKRLVVQAVLTQLLTSAIQFLNVQACDEVQDTYRAFYAPDSTIRHWAISVGRGRCMLQRVDSRVESSWNRRFLTN